MLRLDKYIANLGFLVRSKVRPYMKRYEVLVNGVVADSPDQKICYGDVITFGGEEIQVREFVTVLIYKPAGYVSSDVSEAGYPSYRELLTGCPYVHMLHVAWRLDQDTEWLLLASSDGQLIHRIISPKKKLPKVYFVSLWKPIDGDAIAQLEAGVILDDGYQTLPAEVLRVDNTTIRLTIYEGKFHQVKRMMEAVDNTVVYLKRESIGEWTLDALEKGEWRYDNYEL
jgi:16S rRNA pseudouridine516 synthase